MIGDQDDQVFNKTAGAFMICCAVLKPTNQTSTLEFEVYCVASLPESSFHLDLRSGPFLQTSLTMAP
jgi:hypothetical protein